MYITFSCSYQHTFLSMYVQGTACWSVIHGEIAQSFTPILPTSSARDAPTSAWPMERHMVRHVN